MKNILVFILIIYSSSVLSSQSLCPPNGIITNPDNPINNHNSNFLNDFFDWRTEDFTNYLDPNYKGNVEPGFNVINPYWSSVPEYTYLTGWTDIGQSPDVDYSPIEGWELLTRGFGRNIPIQGGDPFGNVFPEFHSPYFLMYNKYTGKMRLHFSLRSSDITGPFQTVEVKMFFNTPSGSNPKITALFSNNGGISSGGISQPLDQITKTTKVIGIANVPTGGWSHVEFDAAFDPCTCIDNTSIAFEFAGVTTAQVTMTGLLLGMSASANLFTSSSFKDGNRLMSVLKDGFDPTVGTETYKSIDAWIAAAQQAPASSNSLFSPDFVSNLAGFATLFGAAVGLSETIVPLLGSLKILNAAEKAKVSKYIKGAKGIASIAKNSSTILKEFVDPASKKTFPSIIEAEMALSGSVVTTASIALASFIIDNPGTSSSNNTTEFGNYDFPSYPYYNEVLGKFALLKTPKIFIEKSSFFEVTIEGDDPDPDLTSYSATYKVKLDESSIEYVFNPILNLDHENTSIWATIVVNSEEGISEISSDFFEPTRLTSGGFSQTSDLLLLDCLGGFVGEYTYANTTYDENIGSEPLDYLGDHDEYFLQIHIDYVFNELDRNGNKNRAMQLLTYPLEIVESSTPLVNELENVTVGNLTLSGGTFSENISAIGSVIITGDIFAAPGTEIIITGYEIMVEPDVLIGPNVFLIPGIPTGCGTTLAPSSINLNSYCSDGTYKGNQSLVSNTPENSFSSQNPSEEEIDKLKLGDANLETKVYPNPSMDGMFNLAILSSELAQDISISISDATGREVYQSNKSILQYDEFQIDLSSQSKGFYFIQITDDLGNRFFEKIIIE